MKYITTFENLDYSTSFGRKQHLKSINRDKLSNSSYKNEFFEKYPKKNTKIYFKDNQSTYELELFDIIFNGENYDLIFKAENDENILIKNPYEISEKDLEKISLLPIDITSESKDLLNEMFI